MSPGCVSLFRRMKYSVAMTFTSVSQKNETKAEMHDLILLETESLK